MIEIVACFLAVGAVAWATAAAGRLVGISLTAVASGLMAFLMPPVFSLRVESNAGIAALVVNGVVGLLVVHTIRPRRAANRVAEPMQRPPARPPALDDCVLAGAILRTIELDASLRMRASDICVHVDQDSRATIATDDLERILVYILRIAFSHSNVHRIDVYFCSSPRGSMYSTCGRICCPIRIPSLEDNWAKRQLLRRIDAVELARYLFGDLVRQRL